MTSSTPPRGRRTAGPYVALAFIIGGCVVSGTVGNDPGAVSMTSAVGFGSSTTGLPATSVASSNDDPGELDGAGTTSMQPASPEEALELCEVPVVPPSPGSPVITEWIECLGGCMVSIEGTELIDLGQWGDCLCAALDCGPFSGAGASAGSTSAGGGMGTSMGATEGDATVGSATAGGTSGP
ncbi:MAG: hypothetical protein K0V04_06355 [Deltaproteobacteria bacterium]|nr:hypothetical protein [Deltaproteobacteria bacterium]